MKRILILMILLCSFVAVSAYDNELTIPVINNYYHRTDNNESKFDYDEYFDQYLNTTHDVIYKSLTISPNGGSSQTMNLNLNTIFSQFYSEIIIDDDLKVQDGNQIILNSTGIYDWNDLNSLLNISGGETVNVTTEYISITTDSTSGASTSMRNPFDEDTYTTYEYTTNAQSLGIEYDNSTGMFQVLEDGNYLLLYTSNVEISSSDEVNFIVYLNGNITIFEHDWMVHSSVDPVERTVSFIKTLEAGDNLSIEVGTLDGVDSSYFHDGNTINIYQIAGGFSGNAPNITYNIGGDASSGGQKTVLAFANSKGDASGNAQYLAMGGNSIPSSTTYGYVMLRDGSITGMSEIFTSASVLFAGNFRTYIYVNNGLVWSVDDYVNVAGVYKHYATQSAGTDSFSAGDYISIKVDALYSGGYSLVETLLEVEYD